MSTYSEAIEALKAQKEAVQRQAETDVAAIEEIIEKLRTLDGNPRMPLFESAGITLPTKTKAKVPEPIKSSKEEQEEAIRSWLRRHGRPATSREIYQGMVSEGYDFGYAEGYEIRSLGIFLRHRREVLHHDKEANTYSAF